MVEAELFILETPELPFCCRAGESDPGGGGGKPGKKKPKKKKKK